MKKKIDRILFLTLVGITALSVNAQANIIIDGPEGGPDGGSGLGVQNVLFDDLNPVAALTVYGKLNQDTDTFVKFDGTELLVTPPNGQARIEAVDGSFDFISFQLDDPTLGFDKVQFNIDVADDFEGDAFVNLTFTDQFGTAFTGTSPYALDIHGSNWFTAVAVDDQVISTVTINSNAGLAALSDFAQVRLRPNVPTNGVVSEPATMVLVGAGMAGLGFLGSRRRRN